MMVVLSRAPPQPHFKAKYKSLRGHNLFLGRVGPFESLTMLVYLARCRLGEKGHTLSAHWALTPR